MAAEIETEASAETWTRCPPEVEEFVYRDAHLLDECRYDSWWDLFHADGLYWVPGAGRGDSDQISLIHDDKRHLRERINRLEQGKAASQSPPTMTVHVVSAPLEVGTTSADGDRSLVACLTNQVIHYGRGDRLGALAATVRHVVDFSGPSPLIRMKKVTLLTRSQPVPDLSFFL